MHQFGPKSYRGFRVGMVVKPFLHGRSNFQNMNFSIPIADLNPSWKSMNVKCFPFFDIFTRSASKIKMKCQIDLLFELTLFFSLWSPFWLCSCRNIKKRKTLYIHTFSRGVQICNRNWKIPILKIWPPIEEGLDDLTHSEPPVRLRPKLMHFYERADS